MKKKKTTKVRFLLHPEQLALKRKVNTNTVGDKEESHLYVLMYSLGLKLVQKVQNAVWMFMIKLELEPTCISATPLLVHT